MGSSRTYRVLPVARRDNSLASLMRWASPPEESGGLLAQVQVSQTHVLQRLELSRHEGHLLEELQGLAHGHVQDFRHRAPLEPHLQRLAVVTLAFAGFAGDIDIGQEVHGDLEDAIPPGTPRSARLSR